MPGCKSRFKGRDGESVEFPNPTEGESEADEEVRRLWSSAGFVVDVYCPGRSKISVAAPGADNMAPTMENQR